MSELLKPGESGWFRRRDGEIAVAFRLPLEFVRCVWWWSRDNSGNANKCGLARHDSSPSDHDLLERLPDCTGFDWKPQKTYKPWDIASMPAHLLVKRIDDGCRFSASPATEKACFVGDSLETYKDLFDNCVQLDGTPCGVEVDG